MSNAAAIEELKRRLDRVTAPQLQTFKDALLAGAFKVDTRAEKRMINLDKYREVDPARTGFADFQEQVDILSGLIEEYKGKNFPFGESTLGAVNAAAAAAAPRSAAPALLAAVNAKAGAASAAPAMVEEAAAAPARVEMAAPAAAAPAPVEEAPAAAAPARVEMAAPAAAAPAPVEEAPAAAAPARVEMAAPAAPVEEAGAAAARTPLEELEAKIQACQKECAALALEKKALLEFDAKKLIEGISLPSESKLFDLLRDRILDPSPDWTTHLQTLIDIPHSLKGAGYLRGGDYFEALFQVAIAIKELDAFRDKYIHFYDISNYKDLVTIPNYLYTKTVKNSGGGEHGISDITFVCSDTPDPAKFDKSTSYKCGLPIKDDVRTANPMYFISVKGYKKEKSPTKDYDIPLLNLQLSIFPELKEKNIVVCVRDKATFLEKLGRSSDMLRHVLSDRIVGFDDLIKAFTRFRIKIFSRLGPAPSGTEIDALLRQLFPVATVHKPMLSLYFHQELVVDSVVSRIAERTDRTSPHYLCIGVLPRGGKSFIAGGIINRHRALKATKGYNVLFLTSAVNETRTQFREDLITKFSDFDDFSFIDLVAADRAAPKENNFYFISRQLSTLPTAAELAAEEEGPEVSLTPDKKPGEADILETLKRKLGELPPFDICFFDEAHIGISASSVRKNFDSIFSELPGVPIVLMTATYKRPSAVLRSNKDLFVWDLQDIKDMKSLPTLGLEGFLRTDPPPDVLVRYPNAEEIMRRRLSIGETIDSLAKPYLQFASPNFISLAFAPDAVRSMITTGGSYNHMDAFEINKNHDLLRDYARKEEWASLLRNREHAKRLLDFLTPEVDGSTGEILTGETRRFRALNQVFRIAQKNGSRPMQGRPFSILMFMPYRKSEPAKAGKPEVPAIHIGELCRIWASFMRGNRYWRDNFVFLTLSAYGGHTPTGKTIQQAVAEGLVHREEYKKDLKDLIRTVEREALKVDKGLVILSGDVAKMGISLPCVDVVFMMSNNQDADDIIQKMYRALTDDPPQKRDGFIVDLDLKRVVSAMFDYDLEKDKLRVSSVKIPSVEERAVRLFNLCDWGQNEFIEDNAGATFDDVMKIIKERIVNRLRDDKLKGLGEIDLIKREEISHLTENAEMFREVTSVLKDTSKAKGRRGKTEALLTRGADLPALAAAGAASAVEERVSESDNLDDAGTVAPPAPARVEDLTPEQVKHLWTDILQTFVNALVVKSSESWSDKSMNLVALLQKYREDKERLGREPVCECTSTGNCKKTHDNLYELVYCELRPFAYTFNSAEPHVKGQFYAKGSAPKFSHEKLIRLLELVEAAFTTPLMGWNIYIESFLNELRLQSGGRRRRTRRNKNRVVVKKDVYRKTVQRRVRRY